MHLIWKYIIQDFLEIGCRLSPVEMKPLLEAYEEKQPLKKHLEVHPAFSLGDHMTVIISKTTLKECWLYDPEEQKIKKIHLG